MIVRVLFSNSVVIIAVAVLVVVIDLSFLQLWMLTRVLARPQRMGHWGERKWYSRHKQVCYSH